MAMNADAACSIEEEWFKSTPIVCLLAESLSPFLLPTLIHPWTKFDSKPMILKKQTSTTRMVGITNLVHQPNRSRAKMSIHGWKRWRQTPAWQWHHGLWRVTESFEAIKRTTPGWKRRQHEIGNDQARSWKRRDFSSLSSIGKLFLPSLASAKSLSSPFYCWMLFADW